MKNQKSWICLFAVLTSFAHYSIAAKNPNSKRSRAIGNGVVMSDYMFNSVDTQFPDIHPDIMEDTLLPTVNLLLFLIRKKANLIEQIHFHSLLIASTSTKTRIQHRSS